MDKIEVLAAIKYCFLRINLERHYKRVKSNFKGSPPSFSAVKKWVSEFKRDQIFIQNDETLGRPKTVTTDEIVLKIH